MLAVPVRNSIDILLVYPPTGWTDKAMLIAENDAPPIGMLYVASAARQAGLNVAVMDMNHPRATAKDLLRRIAMLRPAIVGFSVLSTSAPTTGALMNQVKHEYPSVSVICGGIHASTVPADLLRYGADCALLGEAEDSIVDIARAVLDGQSPEHFDGVAFVERQENPCGLPPSDPTMILRINGPRAVRTDLDSLPYPARDLVPILDYGQAGAICGSRGCPFDCSFCSSVGTLAHKYRPRSVASVMQELDFMHDEFGLNRFQFLDDNFAVDLRRTQQVVSSLETRPYLWSCQTTISQFNVRPDLLDAMFRAGCREIYFGLESGSRRILSSYKAIDLDAAVDTLRYAASYAAGQGDGALTRLRVVVGFIIGHPEDDEQSVEETIAFALALRRIGIDTMLSILQPYPGSAIANNPDRYGVTVIGNDYAAYLYPRANIATRYLSRETIRGLYAKGLWQIMQTYAGAVGNG